MNEGGAARRQFRGHVFGAVGLAAVVSPGAAIQLPGTTRLGARPAVPVPAARRGGSGDLLEASARHWHGVVAQLTGLGMFRDESEIGYDWFHQGESMLFFYFLTLADPNRWRERAVRFAELYVDPAFGNYDPELGIIRAPHNGSGGARAGLADSPSYPWTAEQAAQYGYPLDWLVPSGSVAPSPDADQDARLPLQVALRPSSPASTGRTAPLRKPGDRPW
jgi:hypothetical protein